MYLLQARASRVLAPRIGYTLWRVWEQFSAMHRARRSGKKKFISAGASASGVSWNTTRRPARSSSVPVSEIVSVGAIRPDEPSGMAFPSPTSTWPRGPGGSSGPNW